MPEGRIIEVDGTVQGVGFRPWVVRLARLLGLRGRVVNTARGVTLTAYGERDDLDALERSLWESAPVAARVRDVRTTEAPFIEASEFDIGESDPAGDRTLAIAPDLGLCAECAAEVLDPGARHFGHAFTSCTACGPRFSVVGELPYDRARTSMAGFPLCDACLREFANPDDRRFHAQSIACPDCGPRFWLADPHGRAMDTPDPLATVAERLVGGAIVGVQGVGGFHLVCDATHEDAVQALRRRKHREGRPLAIMVRDLSAALALAELDEAGCVALLSPARPIVLAPRRTPAPGTAPNLAPGVCGPSRRVGVMLPYSPLHLLLAHRCDRPLVMTSGNVSGTPIAITHAEAVETLGSMVEGFLFHDRPILRRVEDSVVASVAGAYRPIRRARGFAPESIRLPFAAPEPVLGVGGHMKATACLAIGDRAWLTPHLGDLDTFEAEQAYIQDVEDFERLLGVRARVVVHDLHPDYATTRYAQGRDATLRLGVQHHVAHVLAAAVEAGCDGPVLGVVFDGTGFGPDGTSWGAEILRVDGLSWTRPFTFRSLPLPGGEHAIREVWRIAWGALRETFGDEARSLVSRLPLFRRVPPASLAAVDEMIEKDVQIVRARGMGRWFDAIGSLVLGIPTAEFEGHVALALEEVATEPQCGAYPWMAPARQGNTRELDLRPALRALVEDLLLGVTAPIIAARFHQTVIEMTAQSVNLARAADPHGPHAIGLAPSAPTRGAERVVLSGGCFQNRRLANGLIEALGRGTFLARDVPVTDGGLALGQAWAGVLASRRAPGTRPVTPVPGIGNTGGSACV